MLIDHDGPCDLLAGIVAGDGCRLGVDTRLRRELRGLAAEQALLFISTGDLGIIDHHAVRLQATGKLVYGSPFELSVVTRPADAQYIGVVLGIKGEAKGYVTLVLSDKLRTLLKMIPLPRKMSKTPDQVEEFNVYAYVKQLIDGNDVSVLLGVADEVVKVMDTLKFYIPTLKDMSTGLERIMELISATSGTPST